MFYYASDTVFPPDLSAESSSGDGGVEERRGKERLRGRLNALVGDLLVVAKNVSDELEKSGGGGFRADSVGRVRCA
jgi:hypothetical protein